jgi:murein DD-endopeptidase MepM/ murein hydrolase activator NlpD
MAQLLTATALFRERDLFVHDGSKLRRFRLSVPVQAVFFACLLALVGWSCFSAARMAAGTGVVIDNDGQLVSRQVAAIAAATEDRVKRIEQRQQVLAAMLAGEKVDPETIAQLGYTLPEGKGVGGPFDSGAKADPTFKALFSSWKKLDTLSSGVIAVPSDKPVRVASFESAYGVRSDPFEGTRKMHAGIDLSAPVGTPIYATADGVVLRAGWNSGGYGNLVELDHGRAIATRYGHLSAILVHAGQRVTRGQQIGRMGSTGRSTGSHLHYEVRIDGRPVNPVPFMKSTDYLVAMKRKANSGAMETLALGGPDKARR